jgi:hypothetical protein
MAKFSVGDEVIVIRTKKIHKIVPIYFKTIYNVQTEFYYKLDNGVLYWEFELENKNVSKI